MKLNFMISKVKLTGYEQGQKNVSWGFQLFDLTVWYANPLNPQIVDSPCGVYEQKPSSPHAFVVNNGMLSNRRWSSRKFKYCILNSNLQLSGTKFNNCNIQLSGATIRLKHIIMLSCYMYFKCLIKMISPNGHCVQFSASGSWVEDC